MIVGKQYEEEWLFLVIILYSFVGLSEWNHPKSVSQSKWASNDNYMSLQGNEIRENTMAVNLIKTLSWSIIGIDQPEPQIDWQPVPTQIH